MERPNNTLLATILSLSIGVFASTSTLAADIEPPKVNLIDKFGVNMANGQVTHSFNTVSIGGSMGLSDSISVYANEFNFPANRGFNYKYYAWARNVTFCTQPGQCNPENVMRVHDGQGSADFAYYVNGVMQQNGTATANYSYVAVGDTRHTLEAVGNLFKWTKPDGTVVTFDRGATNPMPANDDGYLTSIEYPSGLFVTVTLAGNTVNTNTGFQLKNVYEQDYRPTGKPGAPGLPTSAASGWSSRNPKYVYGVNAAVEWCSWTATTCTFTKTWPRAEFDWAPSMPHTMRYGTTSASVINAQGVKTTYGFTAQDLAYNEFGVLMPGQTGGQNFSPRLTSVSAPNNASVSQVTYDYKNLYASVNFEFGSFDFRLQSAGVTKSASRGSPLNTTYSINEPNGQGSDVRNAGGSINGLPEVHVRGNVAGAVGAINYAETWEGRWTFEMSARNFPYVYAPNVGPRQVMTYDARGNLKKITYNEHLPQGYYIEAEYPASCSPTTRKTCNQATRMRDANGNWTDYSYHAQSGQVERITYPPNKSNIRKETRFTYEQKSAQFYGSDGNWVSGSPIWMKTAEKYCINSTTVDDACSSGDEVVTRYEYNHPNLLMTGMTVTADGITKRTCYQYDIYGNQIGVTTPNANLSSCPAGLAQPAPQVAAAFTNASRYNASGQVTGTLAADPDGGGPIRYRATRNTYGAAGTATAGMLVKSETGQLSGWVSQDTAPAAWSNFTVYKAKTISYDEKGRKSAERLTGTNGATEALTQFSYDEWDRVLCKAVRMNKDVFATPPAAACALGTEGTEGPDRISRYSYNKFDQVLTEERALGTVEAQTYVANQYETDSRQLRYQTDVRGNKTELRYDVNGRLRRRVYPSESIPGSVNENDYNEYDYDANGNVKWERKRNSQTLTNTFDKNNRLIFKDLSDNTYSADVTLAYDLRGLMLSSCFGSSDSCSTSGEGETNVFDGFGNVKSRTSRQDGYARELSYQYDLDNNRRRVTHPDGYFFQYAYDGLNRLDTLRVSLAATPTSSTGSGLDIDYNARGNRQDISRAGTGAAVTNVVLDNALRLQSITQNFAGTANDLTNSFAYNPASQATSLTQTNTIYNYIEANNRVGSYAPNGLNQYDFVDGRALDYDFAGNLTQDRASDGTLTTYTYDMENHLVRVDGQTSATLAYDTLGRLFRFTSGANATHFLYDGDALVSEYFNGTLTRRYVHSDQVDDPLIQYSGTDLSVRRYLHADHQGSIIAHSDTNGAVTQKNSYDPYGIPASTNDGRFGYTGQVWLKELGLNYYKARIYSPRLGRFMQSDPVFYEDDMNVYAYVKNDPIGQRDPTGKVAEVIGEIVVTGTRQAASTVAMTEALALLSMPILFITPRNGWVGSADAACQMETSCKRAEEFAEKWREAQSSTDDNWSDEALEGAREDIVQEAKGGKQNIRDSGLINVPDAEIIKQAGNRGLTGKERKRFQKEAKARGLRHSGQKK